MAIKLGQIETRVIDCHTHVFPRALAPRVIERFLNLSPTEVFSDGTAQGWLEHMDSSGVDISLLLSVPTKPNQVETVNDFLRPFLTSNRFIPFASVHPKHPDPVGVIRRASKDGFKGIKLHPLMQDFKPQDPRMFAAYDAAIEEDMVILFHAGAGMDYDAIRGSKADFDAFFDKYDYGKVVTAHLGGRHNFQDFPEFKTGWPGYIDISFSLGMMPDEYLVDLIRDFGIDNVLYGSDGPWRSESRDLAMLAEIGLSELELEKILYGNAARLLGLN